MRRTVLIVDDSYACGDTLAIALADLPDVDVRMVESSLEALKLIETIPLAAVVTDLHMPRVDGFELIERIRAQPRFASVPIFVVSGDSHVDTPTRLRRRCILCQTVLAARGEACARTVSVCEVAHIGSR